MSGVNVHQCQCPNCQQAAAHPGQVQHRQMNLLLSRLDEQQRRWYVAVQASRIGPHGDEVQRWRHWCWKIRQAIHEWTEMGPQ